MRPNNKLQALGMKYLRKMQGVTRMERIKNSERRKELDIEEIYKTIQYKQLEWLVHITRMKNNRHKWEKKKRKAEKEME